MYAHRVQNGVVHHLAENKSRHLGVAHVVAVLLYPSTCSNTYYVTNFTHVTLLYTYFCTPLFNIMRRRFEAVSMIRGFSNFAGGKGTKPPRLNDGIL